MIELKDISKNYTINANTLCALKGVSLKIQPAEIFGVIGESGAGKSTLLRVINLLEKPCNGEVWIGDTDLTKVQPAVLRKHRQQIGMIFQHFNLLQSRTVFENIALPLELAGVAKETIKQEVHKFLNLVHLEAHQHHYPQQLSGGQKQRVAIARALATKPSVLLCDEPTSALDPHATQTILNLLQEINRQLKVTIVIITHEMSVIKQICDRAGVMHDGELIEYGSVLDLFARPKTQVTQQLVQKSLHLELPPAIVRNLQSDPHPEKSCLVRFTFVGDDSAQPLIANLVQQFQLTINLIQANIEQIQASTVGFTVCQMMGEESAIQAALAFIATTSVTAEVLGYA